MMNSAMMNTSQMWIGGNPTQQTFSAVLRRYSDFLWLYERLHLERAGAIVPPLPEKQPVGRFNQAFVEDRRRQLERFLRRVAVHPELADAKCVETFLKADDVTFQAAKNSKHDASSSQMMMNQSQYNPQNPYSHQPPTMHPTMMS